MSRIYYKIVSLFGHCHVDVPEQPDAETWAELILDKAITDLVHQDYPISALVPLIDPGYRESRIQAYRRATIDEEAWRTYLALRLAIVRVLGREICSTPCFRSYLTQMSVEILDLVDFVDRIGIWVSPPRIHRHDYR